MYAGVRSQDGGKVAIKHVAKAKIKEWGQVSTNEIFKCCCFHDTGLLQLLPLLLYFLSFTILRCFVKENQVKS